MPKQFARLLLTLFLFTHCSLLYILAKQLRYEGHKVVQLIPTAEGHVRQLISWMEADYLQLDFWSLPTLGNTVDVHVTPQNEAQFLRWLRSRSIAHKIIFHDLDRLVEIERGQDPARRRRWIEESVSYVTNTRDGDDSILDPLPPSEQIYAWLDKLEAKYDFMKTEVIGRTLEGRPIRAVKIANGEPNKPIIFLDAGIHAREYMPIGTALWMIQQLTEGYQRLHDVTEMVRRFDWFIVPLANPDGYDYTQTVNRFWRKNRRLNPTGNYTGESDHCNGVDLNRNFNYPFGGPGSSRDWCRTSNRGPHAFSELESLALRSFLRSLPRTPSLAVSFHALSQLWLIPWAYTKRQPNDYDDLYRIATEAVKATETINGRVYKQGPTSHRCPGVSMDWMKGRIGVKYSYTIEMYPDIQTARATGNALHGLFTNRTLLEQSGRETWAGIQAAALAILAENI